MIKRFLYCCAFGALIAGCSSKNEPTPAAETAPLTGMPANTGVLSANAKAGALPVVATTSAAAMPAPGTAPGAHGITYSGVQLDPGIATSCNIPAPKAYFEYD